MSELVSNGVQIYQFPTDDEAVSEINASMNVSHVVMLKKILFFKKTFYLLQENTRFVFVQTLKEALFFRLVPLLNIVGLKRIFSLSN